MSHEKTEQAVTVSDSVPSLPNYLTEEEKKINDDYEWCLHDPEVRRQYGNQVVVAHQRRIWGAGPDHGVAWNAAQQHPDCPHRRVCAFVVVPPLVLALPDSSPSATCVYSPLTEQEKQINDDYEWCLHDPEVRRQYGNQVVVAHQRRIWGAGPDHGVAWNAAQQHPDCPHRRVCAFVVVPPLVPALPDSSLSEA